MQTNPVVNSILNGLLLIGALPPLSGVIPFIGEVADEVIEDIVIPASHPVIREWLQRGDRMDTIVDHPESTVTGIREESSHKLLRPGSSTYHQHLAILLKKSVSVASLG